jgi:hypothetical protein
MRFFFMGPRILGIRPGISFSANELLRLATKPKQNKTGEPMTGSFLYVIRGDHNMVKVGVTTNPSARLASLRTASAFPIDFSYIAVTPGTGFDIEAGAHEVLKSHRCNGEWFDVPPEMAGRGDCRHGSQARPADPAGHCRGRQPDIADRGQWRRAVVEQQLPIRGATLVVAAASANNRRGGIWRHHLCCPCLHVPHRNIAMKQLVELGLGAKK